MAGPLVDAGHDAVRVRDLGLSGASDWVVLERAAREGRVLIPADTDFGQLLAESGGTGPSVIMFRREQDRRAAMQAALVLGNLEPEAGAIVVLQASRVRVRQLPVCGRWE